MPSGPRNGFRGSAPEILWPDVRRLRDVVRPGAGIVDADIVPGRAAEQRVEWLAGRLPDNVPERHVDRRGGADLGAGAAEADIRPCRAGQRLDAASVRADEGGRDPLVDVGVDRGTAEPALAKPDQALVSMDANPDQRQARGEAHRLDLGDLHRSPNILANGALLSRRPPPPACHSRSITTILWKLAFTTFRTPTSPQLRTTRFGCRAR